MLISWGGARETQTKLPSVLFHHYKRSKIVKLQLNIISCTKLSFPFLDGIREKEKLIMIRI